MYYVTHEWFFLQLQIDSQFLQPMCSECICFSVCHSVHPSVRAQKGIWSKWVVTKMKVFFSVCVEGILQLFTNFYLQRKFLIFLRKDRDCKVADPYNRLSQDWPQRGNSKDWLAGQTIQIYYKMTKKRPCTQSGFAKKRTLKQKSY